MKRLLALCLLVAPLSHAQEAPTITVAKSDKLTIAVPPLGGAAGGEATKVLQNDLSMSGYFTIAPSDRAQFVVRGSADRSSLTAEVGDRGGSTVLKKSYSGSSRQEIHQLADEIVETLTGNRGIASSKIAFVGTKSGKKEIYTADVDGFNVVQLTKDNAISVAPHLSLNGHRLLYTGYHSGYADVYQINLQNGARNRIMKYPGTNSGATFSPDGGRVAVTLSKDGNPELYVTSADGGSPRRLTRTAGVESSPTWSPDGDEIIYSSDSGGTPRLYRIAASGGAGRPLSTGYGYNTEPSWSPDGKKVAFTVREGGAFRIALHELQSGANRIFAEGQDPVWGANSRHLIYASGGTLIMLDTQTSKRTTLISGLGKVSEPTWSR